MCIRALAAAALLAGTSAVASEPEHVARISLSESGAIELDGRRVGLDELRAHLLSLRGNGEIWYYRPNPDGEPPPGYEDVLAVTVESGLPIRLATKPDFSEFLRIRARDTQPSRPRGPMEALVRASFVRSFGIALGFAVLGAWLLLRTRGGNPPWPFGCISGALLGGVALVPLLALLGLWLWLT